MTDDLQQKLDEFFKHNETEIKQSQMLTRIITPVITNNIHDTSIFLTMMETIINAWCDKHKIEGEDRKVIYMGLSLIGGQLMSDDELAQLIKDVINE